jgi:hypothetical protein
MPALCSASPGAGAAIVSLSAAIAAKPRFMLVP